MLLIRKWKFKTCAGSQAQGRLVLLLLMCSLAMNSVAQRQIEPRKGPADGVHKHGPVPAKATGSEPRAKSERSIPDVEVLDQDGQSRKFYTDLIKGRVVIINYVYTTCTAFCPMSGNNFSRLQTLLGDRLGRDVYLVSVSTDPTTDSPAKLKAWGEKFNAKAGWTLVTGKNKEMTKLLQYLTGDGPRTGYHVPALSIVNDPKGQLRRVYGLEEPQRVLKATDELAQGPGLN